MSLLAGVCETICHCSNKCQHPYFYVQTYIIIHQSHHVFALPEYNLEHCTWLWQS